MTAAGNRALALIWVVLGAVGLSACASTSTTSTAGFKGEARAAAQAISSLQSDATARNEGKVCADDLAKTTVTLLDSARGGCKQAIKSQLTEVENFEVGVQSVQLGGASELRTATAQVRGIDEGRTRLYTVSLVREGGRWKISAVKLIPLK